jgi:hypothetical protein
MVLAFIGTVFSAWHQLDTRLAVLEEKHTEMLQRLTELEKQAHRYERK